MKNWFQKLISNYPILKYLGITYLVITLFFIIWMLFLDNYSYLNHRVLDAEINELEETKKYYLEEIAKDKQSIKELNNPGQTEKYAREKYFMKKDSEDIYIIEIEGDKIKDSLEGAKQ